MGRRIVVVILVVLAVAALGMVIGAGAYHAGFVNGAAANGKVVAPAAYGYPGYWHGGFGFFPGFFLFPLFLVLLVALFAWRRPMRRWWGYGPRPCGPAYGGPQQAFEDWHREAHGGQPLAGGPQQAGGQQAPVGSAGAGPEPARPADEQPPAGPAEDQPLT
jgi:hypothetical protein